MELENINKGNKIYFLKCHKGFSPLQSFITFLPKNVLQQEKNNRTKENYICELVGALTEDDEFYSLKELRSDYNRFKDEMLYPFGIQVYKCTACNKWIINLLEE